MGDVGSLPHPLSPPARLLSRSGERRHAVRWHAVGAAPEPLRARSRLAVVTSVLTSAYCSHSAPATPCAGAPAAAPFKLGAFFRPSFSPLHRALRSCSHVWIR